MTTEIPAGVSHLTMMTIVAEGLPEEDLMITITTTITADQEEEADKVAAPAMTLIIDQEVLKVVDKAMAVGLATQEATLKLQSAVGKTAVVADQAETMAVAVVIMTMMMTMAALVVVALVVATPAVADKAMVAGLAIQEAMLKLQNAVGKTVVAAADQAVAVAIMMMMTIMEALVVVALVVATPAVADKVMVDGSAIQEAMLKLQNAVGKTVVAADQAETMAVAVAMMMRMMTTAALAVVALVVVILAVADKVMVAGLATQEDMLKLQNAVGKTVVAAEEETITDLTFTCLFAKPGHFYDLALFSPETSKPI